MFDFTFDVLPPTGIGRDAMRYRFSAPLQGSDGIINVLLKNLPIYVISRRSGNFLMPALNSWPKSFKTAKVIPIPKPGRDGTQSSSYRPISLLNNLGKLFEKVINARLMTFAEEQNIINDQQFGFRQQHSTSHQILRVVNHIKSNWIHRRSTGMVLFDIEKAFDSVWYEGLIFKLNKFDVCFNLSNYYSNRFVVRNNVPFDKYCSNDIF